MGNILWCLKMIWLMHYSIIQIGGVQANSQLEPTKLVHPFTNTKLFIQGVTWYTGFRIPTCNILSLVSEIPFFHHLVLTDYLASKCTFLKCCSLAGVPFLLGFLLLRV